MATMEQPVPQQPDIPREYSGQWIAWNHEGTEIIASGDTLTECHRAAHDKSAAQDKNAEQPRFEKVPHLDIRSIGALR